MFICAFHPKNEEISRWKAHINTHNLDWNVLMITDVFLDQKRVNVCEQTVKQQHCLLFTVCSHTFTLFWSRKTSVIVKTFQLSFHMPFVWRSLHFFGKSFLFLFLVFELSVLLFPLTRFYVFTMINFQLMNLVEVPD